MPVSSPTEIFGDFFAQLPVTLLVMVCGSMVLLFAAFAWFAYFKPRRAKNSLSTTPPPPHSSTPPAADMPDLDALLSMDEAPTPTPRNQDGTQVTLKDGATVEARELVAVLRDPRDGQLIVQIDNTGYRSLADVPEVKKAFVKIMRELSTVVEGGSTPPPTPRPEQKPEAPKPATTTTGQMPGDLPRFNQDESMVVKPGGGLFNRTKVEPTPVPEVNIAESIEAYLQHKLRHTPAYNHRQIHVHSAPGGGVRIQVDETFFETVDEVADSEVRAFLTTTIEEWQARQ